MKRLLHFNLNRRVSTFILSFLIAVLPCSQLFSNNLGVTIVSVNQPASGNVGTVTFNLSWDNSWHDLGTVAKNWDAAWIFMKWRDCTASSNTQFTHGLVSTVVSDHTFAGTTTLEPTQADGSAATGGSIDLAPNNTGVMLRTAASPAPYGPVSALVTLKFTNMPNTTQVPALNVKAFGIEMVFVSSGAYFLGDGNSTIKSTNSFALAVGNNTDVSITSESFSPVYETVSTICPLGICSLSTAFPKGSNPFYIMKYEISQGGYCDFLNTLPALAQTIHYTATSGVSPWNYTATAGNRHTINMTQQATGQYLFTVDRPYRACNFLSWADVSAYLAWAALRPLSELEYEKACRGTINALPYETAYGQTTGNRAATIAGAESSGSETISTAGANICAGATTTFSTGDQGNGPLRGGIFATAANSTRALNGSSFYGVMELSGNVDEYYVSALAGTPNGPSNLGLLTGTGMLLDSTGNFNTGLGWPHPLFPSSNGDAATSNTTNLIMRKGGNWSTSILSFPNACSVSQRAGNPFVSRDNTSGGRGGRSSSSGIGTNNSLTFYYTGAQQTFVVPAGVTTVNVDVRGAQGGNGGGLGGRAQGTLTVSPGQSLFVYVGQQGVGTTGGFNGGGIGGASYPGGGASDVRSGGTALANRIIVAGGGGAVAQSGGAGGIGGGVTAIFTSPNYCSAGSGGIGGNAASNGVSNGGGGAGGTPNPGAGGGGGYTGGGILGTNYTTPNSTSGTLGVGGNGSSYGCSGGGGGGGYYGGGGGGSGNCGGGAGGGGSSAVLGASATWTNVSFAGGVQAGNGTVTFSW